VLHELAELGVKRAIRVGTCGETVHPDPELTARRLLATAAGHAQP
jgi:uridine phosphorylase